MKNTFTKSFSRVAMVLLAILLASIILVACSDKPTEPGPNPDPNPEPGTSTSAKPTMSNDTIEYNKVIGDTALIKLSVNYTGDLQFKWYTGDLDSTKVEGDYQIGYQIDDGTKKDEDRGQTLKSKAEYEAMTNDEMSKVGFFKDGNDTILPLRIKEVDGQWYNGVDTAGKNLQYFRMAVRGKEANKEWSEYAYVDVKINIEMPTVYTAAEFLESRPVNFGGSGYNTEYENGPSLFESHEDDSATIKPGTTFAGLGSGDEFIEAGLEGANRLKVTVASNPFLDPEAGDYVAFGLIFNDADNAINSEFDVALAVVDDLYYVSVGTSVTSVGRNAEEVKAQAENASNKFARVIELGEDGFDISFMKSGTPENSSIVAKVANETFESHALANSKGNGNVALRSFTLYHPQVSNVDNQTNVDIESLALSVF